MKESTALQMSILPLMVEGIPGGRGISGGRGLRGWKLLCWDVLFSKPFTGFECCGGSSFSNLPDSEGRRELDLLFFDVVLNLVFFSICNALSHFLSPASSTGLVALF